MLIGLSQKQKQDWSNSLHTYEKAKRTKRPFGNNPQKVQHRNASLIMQNDLKYNPVLQKYRDQRQQFKTIEHEEIKKAKQQIDFMKNNYKYSTDYDIITCNPTISLPQKYRSMSINSQVRKKQYLDPTYQNFNILNGNQYQKQYLDKVQLKIKRNFARKIRPKDQNFNIINNTYIDEKRRSYHIDMNESNYKKSQSLNKSNQMRGYDSIAGRYYNPQQEDRYQLNLKYKESVHGKDQFKKLPLSYRNREGIVDNQVQILTQEAYQQDRRKEQSKLRSKVRYQIEDQYRQREDYLWKKKNLQLKNKVHDGRLLQQKGKPFNIINSQYYAKDRVEELYGKSLTKNPYAYNMSQIMNTSVSSPRNQ